MTVNILILLATIVTAIYIGVRKFFVNRKKAKIITELEVKRAKKAKKAIIVEKRKPIAAELEVIVEEEDLSESNRSS